MMLERVGFGTAATARCVTAHAVSRALRARILAADAGSDKPIPGSTAYPARVRRILTLVASLAIGLVALGLALPRRREARVEALLEAPRTRVLDALAELPTGPDWSAWSPAREGRLEITSLGERGIWFEVTGSPQRRAAIQVTDHSKGAWVVWSDVEHYGFNPIAQIQGALYRSDRVREELERSLSGLRGALE